MKKTTSKATASVAIADLPSTEELKNSIKSTYDRKLEEIKKENTKEKRKITDSPR